MQPTIDDDFINKIVGGQVARPGQYPYQASLRLFKQNQHFCGGAIISTRNILTAAHCFIDGTRAHQIYATVGASNLYDGTNHYVSQIASHPYFNLKAITNDIAVVFVKTPFTFDKLVQPVPIESKFLAGGEEAFVSGWGRFYENGPIATTLQGVKVRVMSNNNCINSYKNHPEKELGTKITNRNLCTTIVKGKGFCSGDSGGPLVSTKGYLIAIVSWSPYGCTYSDYPDVYTRCSVYKTWIDNTINSKYYLRQLALDSFDAINNNRTDIKLI
ncbi:chymotrypsin-2-like [Culicoides brevitarsis]|uniref:chymotrypsin-2-like n=1 Tax=Culicoides brevitarsis TaxID=469753 RepID=UPI00307B9A17